MIFKISQSELDIIKEALVHENSQIKIEPTADSQNGDYAINLDENTADDLRELCGEYLAIVGFDENYNPNDKGNILESLIDKFFIS